MNESQLREAIAALGPWAIDVDVTPGVSTAASGSDALRPRHGCNRLRRFVVPSTATSPPRLARKAIIASPRSEEPSSFYSPPPGPTLMLLDETNHMSWVVSPTRTHP